MASAPPAKTEDAEGLTLEADTIRVMNTSIETRRGTRRVLTCRVRGLHLPHGLVGVEGRVAIGFIQATSFQAVCFRFISFLRLTLYFRAEMYPTARTTLFDDRFSYSTCIMILLLSFPNSLSIQNLFTDEATKPREPGKACRTQTGRARQPACVHTSMHPASR